MATENKPILPPGAILKLLEILGCKYKKYARTYGAVCPFHDDRNPSAIVDPITNTFACTVCGEELVKKWYRMQNKPYKSEPKRYYFISTKAVAFLSGFSKKQWYEFLRKLNEKELPDIKPEREINNQSSTISTTYISSIWKHCEGYIDASSVMYLKLRKINGIKLYRKGVLRYLNPDIIDIYPDLKRYYYQGYRILIPMYDYTGDMIVGLQFRKVPDRYNQELPKAKFYPGSKITDFGIEFLNEKSIASFIVEGSTDYLTLKSAGFKSVIGLSNVNSNFYTKSDLVKSLSDIIFLFYDKDNAGLKLFHRIKSYFRIHYPEKIVIPLNLLSSEVKDVNDFFTMVESPKEVIIEELQKFFSKVLVSKFYRFVSIEDLL